MSDHPSYKDQVRGIVGAFTAAAEDGKFTAREILTLNALVTDAALHVLDGIENPNEHLEELIRDCESVFDEYVPADLPGVPNWIEPTAKMIARQAIRPALTAAIEKIKPA